MGAGKIFCIFGGIVTLLATFLFSFTSSKYGIGFILNIPLKFISGEIIAIVITIVLIIFLLSGIFILIGVSNRGLAIFGSLFAIIVGVYFVLVFYIGMPPEISQFAEYFERAPIVPGVIPLDFAIGSVSLGTILLLVGGVLGLIGGFISSDDL